MIHDPVSQVVRNIKGNLATPEGKPKHRVSSAAKDTVGYGDNVEEKA